MPRKGEPMSAEEKATLSEAKIQRFLASLETRVSEPDHRRCARCGETKPVAAFSPTRKRLASGFIATYPDTWCKSCRAQDAKARHDRMKAEDPDALRRRRRRYYENGDAARRRQYAREYGAAQRREKGVPVKGGWLKYRKKPAGPFLAVEPIAKLLEAELEGGEDLATISAAANLSERRLLAIRKGETPTVTLKTIDAILHGLGKPEEMHRLYPDTSVGYHYLEDD